MNTRKVRAGMDDVENFPLMLECAGGRRLAYAQYGDPAGIPVIHCNGSGGSRLEWPGDQGMLEDMGVRFIGIDRPGHGCSDPQPDRTLLDWPADVSALADHLGIAEFHIEGWSAGGAYALACAFNLPDRVMSGATLSGIAPFDRPSPYEGLPEQIREWMQNAREAPALVYPFREAMGEFLRQRDASQIGAMLAGGEGDDDKEVARRDELQRLMGRNIKEGYRQGFTGPADDDIIINRPWGFDLRDIKPRIDVWQGEIDQNVPRIQGEYQHSLLPSSRFHLLPNTAHMFPLVRWREILAKLIE